MGCYLMSDSRGILLKLDAHFYCTKTASYLYRPCICKTPCTAYTIVFLLGLYVYHLLDTSINIFYAQYTYHVVFT